MPDINGHRLLPYDPNERLALDEVTDLSVRRPVLDYQPDRLWVEVVTTPGAAASVELRLRLDTVEVWHHERMAGVFDRDALRSWWHDPESAFSVDDVTWSIDWRVDVRGRVAITLPDVREWTLSPKDADEVARRL